MTLLFAVLSTLVAGSVVLGHPSAIPLVDLAVTLDEDSLRYETSVPTFAP